MNRVRQVVDNLNVGERIHPDDVMQDLLEVLEEGASPTIGGIYTFIYFAKSPALRYDQHPLVRMEEVFQWGFKAFSFHWREMRQYTWQEMVGGLYEIYPSELADAMELPTAYYRTK